MKKIKELKIRTVCHFRFPPRIARYSGQVSLLGVVDCVDAVELPLMKNDFLKEVHPMRRKETLRGREAAVRNMAR